MIVSTILTCCVLPRSFVLLWQSGLEKETVGFSIEPFVVLEPARTNVRMLFGRECYQNSADFFYKSAHAALAALALGVKFCRAAI